MSDWHFASDHHLFHNKVIEYENRPFENVKEMNEAIIQLHNERVNPKDNVIFGGDLTFGKPEESEEIIKKMYGRKHWVLGNHDKNWKKLAHLFEWVKNDYELKFQKKFIVIHHYPKLVWNKKHHGAIHLHGHCHGNLQVKLKKGNEIFDYYDQKVMDISLDSINFKPVSFQEVEKIMENKVDFPIDHH